MSPDTPAQSTSLAEPQFVDGKWRVEATCRTCGVTMRLDSPPKIRAEDFWGDACQLDERGTTIKLPKPNDHALRIASSAMVCEHCSSEIDKAEERHRRAMDFSGRIKRSGLPAGLRELKWSDMDRDHGRRNTIVATHAWTERGGKLLLYGPVGTGKTRLAATACWDFLPHGDCLWVSVPVLLQIAFAEKQSPEKSRAAKVMADGRIPLILDDLGKEKPGDWARQVLFGAIDSRIQEGTPILVTSNYDPDQIAGRLGEAFGSRLLEFNQHMLGGRDRREPALELPL